MLALTNLYIISPQLKIYNDECHEKRFGRKENKKNVFYIP